MDKLQEWCTTKERLDAYKKAQEQVQEEYRSYHKTLVDIGFDYYNSLWSPLGQAGIEVVYKDGSTELFKGDILMFIKSKSEII